MARFRETLTALLERAAHPSAVAIAFAALTFWLGFAVGNSLITQKALEDQRAIYISSLATLREGIQQDWLSERNRSLHRNGGSPANLRQPP